MNGAERLCQRRWRFAGCIFDESDWTLVVNGRRVRIEAKPLELLRELLLNAGKLVTKDQLLERTWPDLHVVEASLPTAIHKLRLALRDDRPDRRIIETVSGIGYRLRVPVEAELLTGPCADPAPVRAEPQLPAAPPPAAEAASRSNRPVLLLSIGGLALLLAAVGVAVGVIPSGPSPASAAKTSYTQRDAANALRKLDVGTIDDMLAAGWNPNTPFDDQGNGAVNYVLNICEWNRGHDQSQLLLMVRTLIDGGARLDRRNVWGDTPYSIAKAQRYCGPDHPVTRSIRTMCYAGFKPLGDRCLASYELERAART